MGGMLRQLLLAGIAGVAIWITMHWKRLLTSLNLRKRAPNP